MHTFYHLKCMSFTANTEKSRKKRIEKYPSLNCTNWIWFAFPKITVNGTMVIFKSNGLFLHFASSSDGVIRTTLSCISVVNWCCAVQCKVIVKRLWSNITRNMVQLEYISFFFLRCVVAVNFSSWSLSFTKLKWCIEIATAVYRYPIKMPNLWKFNSNPISVVPNAILLQRCSKIDWTN